MTGSQGITPSLCELSGDSGMSSGFGELSRSPRICPDFGVVLRTPWSHNLAELEPRRIALTMKTLGPASIADWTRTVALATLLPTRAASRV